MFIRLWWSAGLTATTIAGITITRWRKNLGLSVLMSLFAGYVLSANILVPRLVNIELVFSDVILTTGSLIWPFTAQLSDMINEVHGKQKAYISAVVAYIVNLIFITFVFMGAAASPLWSESNEAFWLEYFTPAPRILAASSLSFFLSQIIDISIFAKLKTYFYKSELSADMKQLIGYSSLRSMLSDIINMAMDGLLFALFAFAFILPWNELKDLMFGSVQAKIIIAVIDTPWFIAFRVGIRNIRREM